MVAVIYAIALCLWMIFLAFKVISLRRKHKVGLADGGIHELTVARAAQSNASEYIPITLILLFALELNGVPLLWVHLCGCVFIVGRILHGRGMLKEIMGARVLGMQMTLVAMLALCLLNLAYLPYAILFTFLL